MKNSRSLIVFSVVLISLIASSCAAIEGIFKAGMGVGIFVVIAVIALIIFIISRAFKK